MIGPTFPPPTPPTKRDEALYNAAQKLEVTFLSNMLESAGLGKSRSSFGGGAGEDQFASFLVQNQAESIVESGGIGLSEILYHQLKEQSDD